MKLKFKATREKPKHRGRDLYFKNGDRKEVDVKRGEKLLRDFPDNFFKILPSRPSTKKTVVGRFPPLEKIVPPTPSSEEYRPPLRKELRLSDITVAIINYWPDNFKTHLLPCIPKEVEFIPMENIDNIYWTSGAKAFNYAIGMATNDIVMCCHGDLVLGQKWWENFIYHEARLKDWGALGISGWDWNNRLVWGKEILSPYKVQCLDENCIIVNRKNGFLFDENVFTDWHCYGADYCLQCYDRKLDVYVIPGACSHNGVAIYKVGNFLDKRDKTLITLKEKWKGKVSQINMGFK